MRKFIEEFNWCLETCFDKYAKQAAILIPVVWMQYCEGLINKTQVCIALYDYQNEREASEAAMRRAIERYDGPSPGPAIYENVDAPWVSR